MNILETKLNRKNLIKHLDSLSRKLFLTLPKMDKREAQSHESQNEKIYVNAQGLTPKDTDRPYVIRK